jgi:hypothetical protein
MTRLVGPGVLALFLIGCQLPPERGEALRPLPEEVRPLPYAELLTRARYQVDTTTEAYLLDKWDTIEDSAKALEQTARYMVKATEVPEKHKGSLAVTSGDLAKLASDLREAARDKDADKVKDAMTKVISKVRELKID